MKQRRISNLMSFQVIVFFFSFPQLTLATITMTLIYNIRHCCEEYKSNIIATIKNAAQQRSRMLNSCDVGDLCSNIQICGAIFTLLYVHIYLYFPWLFNQLNWPKASVIVKGRNFFSSNVSFYTDTVAQFSLYDEIFYLQ